MNLDGDRFDKCLEGSGSQAASIKKDAEEAQRLGLQGTPSFFINGHFMSGSIGYAETAGNRDARTRSNFWQIETERCVSPIAQRGREKVKVRNPSPEKQGPAKSRWAFYYLIMGLLFNSCWDWPAKLRPMVAQS